MKANNKKGISLIVLVITIIVMIILATAIILSLDSSNIVEKAKEAKTTSDLANAKNVVTLATAEWELMTESEQNAYNESFSSYAISKLQEAGFKTTAGQNSYTVTESGSLISSGKNELYIDSNGDKTIIPEGFVVSDVSTEDEISEGLVIYEGLDKVSTDTDATETRNQYVWVPVEGNFERVNWNNEADFANIYTEPYSYDTTITAANDITGEYAEYAKMKASVEKYGGFYIARYEAGTNVERVYGNANGTTDVLVQKGKPVYNFVAWGASMTDVTGDIGSDGKGAVELSRSVYPENSNEAIVSTLIYGVQWDAALKFISKTDSSYVLNVDGNAGGKGNYDGELAITGSYNAYAINNIYDMAGNVQEWTMESCFGDGRVFRGGFFVVGSAGPADRTTARNTDIILKESNKGFRIALYLK